MVTGKIFKDHFHVELAVKFGSKNWLIFDNIIANVWYGTV